MPLRQPGHPTTKGEDVLATVAVPSEDQLALLTPTQQRHIMRDLAAKLRTLRDESARAKARLDEIGNPANIKVVDAGLNVAGAFSAGAVYEALQARIDAGTLDEKWLHVGGGIDTTLLGSLGLALAGVALANYGENSAEQPDAELSDEGTETRDESWYSAQNVGAGLA